MKIEIEWSREDVLDILKAIAWIPQVIIKQVKRKEDPVTIQPEPTAQEITEPETLPVPQEEYPTPKKSRCSSKSEGGGGKPKRQIDVFAWEIGKWFSLEASFDSISAAARHIGVAAAANISPYVDSWKVYKGKYKFISRKA